ncbi:hypothetical protein BDW02DRAFT_574017 [Decorospora gaudefroyi]|uniref:Uncharacterized protein n=1 Tax=Decorospora gaudefroyi TaxID=184978 RepID=A0A6A5K026_9PLEO|nr:hypothetical protein BDW02DRAFT_574017 [Decorospora gaudefroyi]
MALKHLLNEEDFEDIYQNHHPQDRQDFFDDFNPVLPTQTWDQYVHELFGSETLQCGFIQEQYGVNTYDTLQDTRHYIEQWATGNEVSQVAVEEVLPQEPYICYGTIFRAPVKLRGSMMDLNSKLNYSPTSPIQGHTQMKIIKPETKFLVTFPDETVVGDINAQLEKALNGIAEQGYELDFEVFAPVRAIQETLGRAREGKEAIVRIQINVYGPRMIAQDIGKELSQHKIYLQRPGYVRDGAAYENPHVLNLTGIQCSSMEIPVPLEETLPERETAKIVERAISGIYSSLTRSLNLHGIEGDERLNTSLLLHQKTALAFMIQRENGPIPDEYKLWKPAVLEGVSCYRHAVTNTRSMIELVETGGGILADEMGMGKSLSILAMILRTLNAAHEWAACDDMGHSKGRGLRRRSRATLIVASSDLMINEWFQELNKHFDGPTRAVINAIKYHGQRRHFVADSLVEADIVITTYHTLVSDFKGTKNDLRNMEWYRLVLDEAHIIRRQSTVLYRTVAEIAARSRWCLTGTPIQNRLEDIGSLLAFLRVSPFHNLSNFRRHIAVPFDEGGKRRQLAIQRFTTLLDSLCLRRTKDVLHLPEEEHRVRKVQLSLEERTQYDQTQNIMFRAVRNQNGSFDQKSTLGMFQVQLQLRIICNHGTWQQPFSWNRRKLHLLDEREAMVASFGREGEITCSVCQQTMPLSNTGSMYRHYTEHCRHVLCSECLEQSIPHGHESTPEKCPLCAPLWANSSQALRQVPSYQEDTYFRAEGRSSKMDVLMSDVLADIWGTKSIIFTCWTRTLDLIQNYLMAASRGTWKFERIDGECATSKREQILDEFSDDCQLRVLIMTTGTGAVGLNLATANRVFIVEPQWNPSVENQAIARALRLGQKQPVLVTRYVVEETVEQDMRALQENKRERANLIEG